MQQHLIIMLMQINITILTMIYGAYLLTPHVDPDSLFRILELPQLQS